MDLLFVRWKQRHLSLKCQRSRENHRNLEGPGPRGLGVRGISGIYTSGGYSCHFEAPSICSRIFSWPSFSNFECFSVFRGTVEQRRRTWWDRRLVSSGLQAPMRTAKRLRPGSLTVLKHLTQPSTWGTGKRHTSAGFIALPLHLPQPHVSRAQLVIRPCEALRGSGRRTLPVRAGPIGCAPCCVAAFDRERTKVVRLLLPFRCLC